MRSIKKEKDLYFIALVPEEPVYSEIWQLKEEMRDRFETKAALRSPPHITLHMPFKWSPEKETVLFETLRSIAHEHKPLNLQLENFEAFEPRVIYINVLENDALKTLQKAIARKAASDWHIYQLPNSRPFRPHMTIAFRDLKKPKFHQAWSEFSKRQYKNQCNISSISLLKHNGRTWDIHKKFNLSSS